MDRVEGDLFPFLFLDDPDHVNNSVSSFKASIQPLPGDDIPPEEETLTIPGVRGEAPGKDADFMTAGQKIVNNSFPDETVPSRNSDLHEDLL